MRREEGAGRSGWLTHEVSRSHFVFSLLKYSFKAGVTDNQEAGIEQLLVFLPPARTYSMLGQCVCVCVYVSVPPGLFLPSHPFLPQGVSAFREGIWEPSVWLLGAE